MSIASRQRHQKRPTHNSGKRPRLYGEVSKPTLFDLTGFQKQAHHANKSAKRVGGDAHGRSRGLSGFPPKLRAERRQNLGIALAQKKAMAAMAAR